MYSLALLTKPLALASLAGALLAIPLTHRLNNIRVKFSRILSDVHWPLTAQHEVSLNLLIIEFPLLNGGESGAVGLLIVLVIAPLGTSVYQLLCVFCLLFFFSWLLDRSVGFEIVVHFNSGSQIEVGKVKVLVSRGMVFLVFGMLILLLVSMEWREFILLVRWLLIQSFKPCNWPVSIIQRWCRLRIFWLLLLLLKMCLNPILNLECLLNLSFMLLFLVFHLR